MVFNFLFLSILAWIPGGIIYVIRRDLRSVIYVMTLCALPFAFTERLFYPAYWEPECVFNLIAVMGFGIEDILFVTGLAAFTSTAYAFCFRARYSAISNERSGPVFYRALAILGLAFMMVFVLLLMDVEIIYGSFAAMLGISGIIAILRHDLLMPAFMGGCLSLVIYSILCLCLQSLSPDVFQLEWHTDKFWNIFIVGVPIEEFIYGFAAGMIGTVFYPFVFRMRFEPWISGADPC